jgi:phosphatidylglycerol:prolipoprotein diacylglycerol transferase
LYPELFSIGPFTIHTYGLMFALGIVAAVVLSECQHMRTGGKVGIITDMALPVMAGVLVGARGLFILVERSYFIENPLEMLAVWKGGLVFYGGFIGGALAFILVAWWWKLDVWHLADNVAPGLALGHGIGRLGCFFAGSCYGKPTSLPWAVTYTDPDSLARAIIGVPVHPVQLYSAAFLACLSVILYRMGPRAAFKGQVIATYGMVYGTYRFSVEFLRGDPRGALAIGELVLSTSQVISLLLVPVMAVVYMKLAGRSEVVSDGVG